ncbi:Transcriptional regulator, AbiEi antitoxin, Type IV TA system [Parafrankia irregularis]|uniref:Transcriptional regulator, AbiEi antitoxin, Type IV TA system n=2 Tax=Parafrankia irregularis TaxID=795642 RepID=A0A0S4QXP6_9ACTN|nr:Transcriptional regulator, AbiEi antitoxin, Type IV TA system [Parafrankia irregularis]
MDNAHCLGMTARPGRLPWQEIADLQSGVISERDAIGAGLTRADIRARVTAGTWRQPAPGVLITTAAGPALVQRAWAGLLAGGQGAVLGGATAAELDGLVDHDDEVVTVLVPPERRNAPVPGVAFRRTARLTPADVHRARLPPRTVPARSVVDLAEWSGDRGAARTVVVDALGQGFVTVEAMRRALARRGPIIRRTLIGETLDDQSRRTPKLLSRLYRQIEIAFSLPTGQTVAVGSPDLPTGRLDVWYRPWRVLVRVGRPGPARVLSTTKVVLTVPTEHLWETPEEVAALVGAALRERAPIRPAAGPHACADRAVPSGEWHEPVRDELGEDDQGGGEGVAPAVASRQMRELPPWEAERAARQQPVPPTA